MAKKTKAKKSPKKAPATAEAATPPAPAAKPKKGKQLKLPGEGMARKGIPELDAQAERFRIARDARMEHSKAEYKAKQDEDITVRKRKVAEDEE